MAGTLDAYKKKRDFTITSEPKPKKGKGGGFSFVVQKHAARRLHYDFRLELDGVLKSWAVTKGPSLVPGEKRLAVHVEDHPLAYGEFEGTIPPGQYGAGSVMVWDRGTWTPEGDPAKGYAKGHLDFSLEGEKLKGRWHLVRMRGKAGEGHENWLLIKSDDAEARDESESDVLDTLDRSVLTGRSIEEIGSDHKSRQWTTGKAAAPEPIPVSGAASSPRRRAAEAVRAVAKQATAPVARKSEPAQSARTGRKTKAPEAPQLTLPKGARGDAPLAYVEPQLATLATTPPTGEAWLHEIKFDGYRMQAILQDGAARLWTRRGLDWSDRFGSIVQAVEALPFDRLHFDGEIVVEDSNGISDFAALQAALKSGDTSRLVYYVFDLLAAEGRDLRKVPLIERKRLLEEIVKAAGEGAALRYSAHFEADGAVMLRHVCALSAEGIVSKKRSGTYRSGRVPDWLKAKCANRQEFVVIGFVPSTSARKSIGSLVMGYHEGGKLIYAGRVGTGFSNRLASDLYADLSSIKQAKSPLPGPLPAEARKGVVWVEPLRVAEVEFRGWTGAGVLRQAAFKGLREDKDAKDIVREDKDAEPSARPSEPSFSVKLTHPDRVLWPDAGITKEGLADYYTTVWPYIAPHVTGRPLALVRCPTGIEQTCFFQKHSWKGMDASVHKITDPQDKEELVAIEDLDGLIALVQASVLEIHPWGARQDDLDHPDQLTFDLDPGENVPWSALVAGAVEVHARLTQRKLKSFVKTSGGKGLHVVVPLTPKADWETAKAFCQSIAVDMAKDAPDLYTATMAKRARDGRIYIDYLRNGRGATAVAAYSPRARANAGVSTPLTWDELESSISGEHFTLLNIGKRLSHLARDPWAGFHAVQQELPEPRTRGKRR